MRLIAARIHITFFSPMYFPHGLPPTSLAESPKTSMAGTRSDGVASPSSRATARSPRGSAAYSVPDESDSTAPFRPPSAAGSVPTPSTDVMKEGSSA